MGQMMTVEKSLQAKLQGMVSRGVRSAHIDGDGHLIFVMTDGALLDLGIVTESGSLFVVGITEHDDGSCTADKPFFEIRQAVSEGRRVIATLAAGDRGSFYGALHACSESLIQFGGWCRSGEFDTSFAVNIYRTDDVTVGYPDYEERYPVSVAAVKEGSTVTVTAAYADDSTAVSVIELDEEGNPLSVTRGGVTTALSWEGFDV